MILVQHILEDAQRRLAVLNREAPLADVAEILVDPKTPLVVVCDSEGVAVGVVSRTDVVKVFRRARLDMFDTSAEAIMTRSVLSCHVDQTLQSVWDTMSTRGLRCSPVLDSSGRPQGVVHARDLARALLGEVENDEELLRDYVLGVGYQ